jgi:hypothetical protein
MPDHAWHAHGSLLELLLHPPAGARIEPVCLDAEGVYRYARRFTLRLLDCPEQCWKTNLRSSVPATCWWHRSSRAPGRILRPCATPACWWSFA